MYLYASPQLAHISCCNWIRHNIWAKHACVYMCSASVRAESITEVFCMSRGEQALIVSSLS